MWERAMLKHYAKQELRTSYWISFAVCLVGGILGGGGVGSGGGSHSFSYQFSSGLYDPYYVNWGLILAIFSIITAAFACFGIFVSNPISAGISDFFLRAPFGQRDFGTLFSFFQKGRYGSAVKTMFFTQLAVFGWSLLFVIPGIIKSYEYRMVPYLIAENPLLTPTECKQYSSQMTYGHKMDMWVLDLSFIGWYLLGALALGLGILFVTPYVEATWAQLYYVLRRNIIIPTAQQGPAPY